MNEPSSCHSSEGGLTYLPGSSSVPKVSTQSLVLSLSSVARRENAKELVALSLALFFFSFGLVVVLAAGPFLRGGVGGGVGPIGRDAVGLAGEVEPLVVAGGPAVEVDANFAGALILELRLGRGRRLWGGVAVLLLLLGRRRRRVAVEVVALLVVALLVVALLGPQGQGRRRRDELFVDDFGAEPAVGLDAEGVDLGVDGGDVLVELAVVAEDDVVVEVRLGEVAAGLLGGGAPLAHVLADEGGLGVEVRGEGPGDLAPLAAALAADPVAR
eukprot:CAMPEP_0118899138 /NCGR_PEP_ID=MMETSP1166-20130328/5830_1 /TAXON_ID=1104430 /ORGANISM="Chrysoreinhardia sp, Strain CCMP3193" /LENGTH=270 /DNA_ID=CAMNT_0006838259 /DNA_START=127 /DNA_END=935 /DNA_ORIENTATION=-